MLRIKPRWLSIGLGLFAFSTIAEAVQENQQASFYAAPRQSPVAAVTPAMQYFGGASGIVAHSAPAPRAAMPAPQPVQLRGSSKPFQTISRAPTLSPYLWLDMTTDAGLPNYHAYTRPQIEKRKASAAQRAELRRIQQRLRSANANGIVSPNPSGGIPTTGHSRQFMNVGGYFPPPQ